MNFLSFIGGRKPANKTYNFMEIKELSEIMEAARSEAAPYVVAYLRAAKDYERACLRYQDQCSQARKY